MTRGPWSELSCGLWQGPWSDRELRRPKPDGRKGGVPLQPPGPPGSAVSCCPSCRAHPQRGLSVLWCSGAKGHQGVCLPYTSAQPLRASGDPATGEPQATVTSLPLPASHTLSSTRGLQSRQQGGAPTWGCQHTQAQPRSDSLGFRGGAGRTTPASKGRNWREFSC